ncbi:MAG: Com family DNA-binding transcriptional regulator [Eubacterium sp.]|nr:Com family DNA-binding transcriptional regulator [Eubacterium sp.]
MQRIKCTNCSQTLCFADVMRAEIKCPRCGCLNRIEFIRREKKTKSKSR